MVCLLWHFACSVMSLLHIEDTVTGTRSGDAQVTRLYLFFVLEIFTE